MDLKIFVSKYERPYFFTRPPLPPPPPPPPPTVNLESHGFNLNEKVSPSVLLIIIILAIIFFISGLLHLLIRFLVRPSNRDPDEFDNVTALQGQLQQLFHLHDSGVDQSFIDTLPIFTYKSIIGVKNPFDCAVCLCEFEGDDKLRLLPKCSHAFHMDCIDTWLLSHSTCPLCRSSLLCDNFSANSCSPIVLVLESGSNEISREIVNSDQPNSSSIQPVNTHLSNDEFDKKEAEKEEDNKEKIVSIKLGKFKNVDVGESEDSTSDKHIDARRCFSMGSFEYVMYDNSSLQVPIRTQVKKQASKKSSLPITPGHQPAMSECGGGDSRRSFTGVEALNGINGGNGGGGIGKSKRESFSVSKIWLRGKKEKPTSMAAAIGPSSRESFSFRFPVHRNELKAKRRAKSDVDIIGRGEWLDSPPPETATNPPSFARRTLLWLMGRQQIKVVHSSCPTNV